MLGLAILGCEVPVTSPVEQGGVRTVDSAALHDAGPVPVVDVRTPGEFASGHVPGAVNIPVDQLGARLGELDPAVETWVICESGARSYAAARLLADAGFRPVDVSDGMRGWRRRYPTEK
ncbi:MAG: rhodanese-like domain-containing protein [Myxococcota bacterium]